MYIQVMTYEQAEKWEFNPFDLTKVCMAVLCVVGDASQVCGMWCKQVHACVIASILAPLP